MQKEKTIKYSEIFYSIQGEGSLMGIPSVFFRTSFCNLRCFFCDTPYTSHTPENKRIILNNAIDRILAYKCDHIVITGGEPFLQPEALQSICKVLKSKNQHITIETNGTIYSHTEADLLSISPKLSDSGPKLNQTTVRWQKKHDEDRINLPVLKLFLLNHTCQFKFVVHEERHIEEIRAFQELLPLPDNFIYLMPEGRTPLDLINKQRWVVEACLENNWNYSDRLHVRIWGDKRGV